MPSGVYPRTSEHRANTSAAMQKFNKEHPGIQKEVQNIPEIFELINTYDSPLINKLRKKYYDLNGRCNNPNCPEYEHYGSRGIQNLFTSQLDFLLYVINELHITTLEQIEGLEIDRVDNNGNYEPGNIRFVTHQANSNNRRSSRRS